MAGTKLSRDERRAWHWLGQTGGMPYVPEPAFALLVVRLRIRRRVIGPRLWLVGPVIIGLFVWSGRDIVTGSFGVAAQRGFAVSIVLSLLLISAANFQADSRAQRAESEIALARRVTRSESVPLSTVLGWARYAFLIVAVVLQAAIAVAVLVAQIQWLDWAYPIAFLISVGLTCLGIRQTLSAPTLAVDPFSLAIDERLRAEAAFSAISPMATLIFAFPSALLLESSPEWLSRPWTFCSMGLIGLWVVATLRTPWCGGPHWIPPSPSGLSGPAWVSE